MANPLIIFDCDGTLVDSERLNNMALVSVFEELGLDQYDLEYAMDHFTGMRFSQILADIHEETGFVFPENCVASYLDRVRELAPSNLEAVKGAKELIEFVRDDYNICVVSNGERNNVLGALALAELKDYFLEDHIFTGLMAAPKPAPDLFLLAMKHLASDANETIIIEDSVIGVRAANAAKAHVCGFAGTHHKPEYHKKRLLEAGADISFLCLYDVPSYLDSYKD